MRWPPLPRSNRASPLKLDFAPAAQRAPALGWVLLGAGSVAAIVAALQFQLAHAARSREAGALTELNEQLHERRAGGRTQRTDPRDARRAQAAAAVARELQVPWATLLGSLEAVAGRDVALLVVEPSAARQTVRITAEARTSGAMFDYLDALRAQALAEVALVSHQVQAQAPGAPIRFQVQARWGSR
jgi:Tfp pilus assembly protein PilN